MITVQQTQYFSILINGSENTRVNAYEMKCMFYMGKTPLPSIKLLSLNEAKQMDTEGLKNNS